MEKMMIEMIKGVGKDHAEHNYKMLVKLIMEMTTYCNDRDDKHDADHH